MDRISPERRSENMRRIRSRNTSPELAVRSALRRLGIGYRVNSASLPGKPDISMTGRKTAIFVHGCFWHQHKGCSFTYTPASNTGYWLPKLAATKQRDRKTCRKLQAAGWHVVTIWECETRNSAALISRLTKVFGQ